MQKSQESAFTQYFFCNFLHLTLTRAKRIFKCSPRNLTPFNSIGIIQSCVTLTLL